jgi:molybdate transport system substrate-binding protein
MHSSVRIAGSAAAWGSRFVQVATWLLAGLLGGLSLTAAAQPAAAALPTLKVLSAGAFKQVALAFVPAFEARSGVKVVVDNDTAGGLARRVQSGEPFDVLIMPPAGLAALAREGKVDAASTAPVARVAIGVAVKSGAPRPPLETVDQFREAVLRAGKVAYIDPAAGGSSGIYLTGLFQRLGLADAVRAKAVLVPGGLVAERITRGEADLAIHQVSEILPVPGVDLVGLLPEAIQNYTTYAAAVSSTSAMAPAARAFIGVLVAPEAAVMLRDKGMSPP